MITSPRLLQFFIGFAILYSLLLLTGNDILTWYLKPLLLPFLFFAVAKSGTFSTKKWLLAALLFSWIGDCILMFADKGELYFIFGLVAFLVAHILFIVLFTKQKAIYKNFFKRSLFWTGFALATVYLMSILYFLLPKLGNLKFPVMIYALTITIMLKTALKGTFDWDGKGKHSVLLGAVFFVASDSILAINKFHTPLESASYSVMITYLIAQYLIVSGILKLNQKNSVSKETLTVI